MKNKGIIYLLFLGCILYIIISNKILLKIICNNKKNENKNYAMLLLCIQWIYKLQTGKFIGNYFKEKGYEKIAIYGMGEFGKALLNELQKSNLDVSYVIDKNAGEIFMEIPVITPESQFDHVDAIIVTPFLQYDSIKEMLQKKISCPILSIADVINEL